LLTKVIAEFVAVAAPDSVGKGLPEVTGFAPAGTSSELLAARKTG